jgi:hypothetical protein
MGMLLLLLTLAMFSVEQGYLQPQYHTGVVKAKYLLYFN